MSPPEEDEQPELIPAPLIDKHSNEEKKLEEFLQNKMNQEELEEDEITTKSGKKGAKTKNQESGALSLPEESDDWKEPSND